MKNLLASTIILLATASFAVVPNLLECTGEGIALSYLENDGRVSLRLVDGKKAVKIDSVAGIISTPSPLGTLITAIDQIFPSETHYVSFVMPRINFMSGQTSMPVITSLIEHVSRKNERADGLVDEVTRVVMIKCEALIFAPCEEFPPSEPTNS
jgi:hypothetical protein